MTLVVTDTTVLALSPETVRAKLIEVLSLLGASVQSVRNISGVMPFIPKDTEPHFCTCQATIQSLLHGNTLVDTSFYVYDTGEVRMVLGRQIAPVDPETIKKLCYNMF